MEKPTPNAQEGILIIFFQAQEIYASIYIRKASF